MSTLFAEQEIPARAQPRPVNKRVVGIDVGLDGGIVILDPDVDPVLFAMPTEEIKQTGAKKGSSKREYNIPRIKEILTLNPPRMVFIEKQQAMSQPVVRRCDGCDRVIGMTTPQGAVSIFSHARGYGLIEGVVAGLGIPYELTHTKTWQTELLSGSGDTKARARMACGRLFPGVDLRASTRARNPHEGIVDALLLAVFGQRKLGIVAEDPLLGF